MNKFYPLFFILLTNFLLAQSTKEIDSLNLIVKTTPNDSVRVAVLNKIAFHYVFNDAKKAMKFLKQSEKLALSKKKLYGYNETINIKGIINDIGGNSDSANYYFKKSLAFSKKHHFGTMEARSLNGLGMNNWHKGNWKLALHYFFEALRINETLPEDKKINESICFNNIGLIYQEMKLFDKAIVYHKKSYSIRLKDKLYKDQASSLNNLGICYRNKKEYEQAIFYFNKAIGVAKTSNNIVDYYKVKTNLGNLYFDLKNYDKALELYLENYHKRDEILDNQHNFIVLIRISECYNGLKDYKKAEQFSSKALAELRVNGGLKQFSSDLFRSLATTHYALGNIEKGEQYNMEYYNLLNETFSKTNSKDFTEIEAKYQNQKKEADLLKAKNKIIQNEMASKQKNLWIVLLASLFVIGIILFRNLQSKSKLQKEQLELENKLLEEQSNYKIQEQRLEISRELHDNVGSQLTFIISILDNLKNSPVKFEEAIDKKIDTLSNFAGKSISELRDTIWVLNAKELSLSELKSRMLNFVKDAGESDENTKFNFNYDIADDVELTSKQAINIYRTLQEILNNAIKHADASLIFVEINQIQTQLEIQISDNGIGFDYEAKKKKSFGLTNIQNRIQEIEGDLKVKSTIEEGTIYFISIPL
jgi:signal transduction histidine kinase/Flp pilus assembly protein TadD